MAIKIKFDAAGNPEEPTVILARKNGDKLGRIEARAIEVTDRLNDASEISFKVYKYLDGEKCELWDEITDFKLVYCVEWNMWFEAVVELDESEESVKTVFCKSLGHAELSQIMLYNIQINTEDDIAREEYTEPTVLYNPDLPSSSLLHRIMEKAPHYSVKHVDHTIKNIQRTFEFDDTSIYDAFQEIAEEIHCFFYLNVHSDGNGKMQRTVSVYDLEANCAACRHRGEFVDVCPECGSKDITEGYGNDTSVFIASDDIAESIGLTTDVDSVKNCFKLEAGDDLMTSTIRNCNPNGSDYIWYFSDATKKEMPKELVDKIESYDKKYLYYQKEYVALQNENGYTTEYNKLVDKYLYLNKELGKIKVPIVGYPSLMNAFYNVIDMKMFLKNSMMPTIEVASTNAQKEVAKLTRANMSPVSAQSIKSLSKATADSIVLSMAKVIVDSRYRVKVESSTFAKGEIECTWTGAFAVDNYSDKEDKAVSQNVTITINDNYEMFVKQKIDRILNSGDKERLDIVGLFKKPLLSFAAELKVYCLNRLLSFRDACQTCIDILIEQGIADNKTWSGGEKNLYNDLYVPYLKKLDAIDAEIKVRESEIIVVDGEVDKNGEIKQRGARNFIEEKVDEIQKDLDFEAHLGNDMWLVFCSFRREDKFSNDNYISDGLDNAELFDRAREFIKIAQEEIFKSAELQHSISSTLKNLLVIDKFKPIVNDFRIGNWLRVMVDDVVYKLRLIEYSIDYEDIESISVEFSDVTKSKGSASDIESILNQSSSMATSYDTVKRQAKKGQDGNSRLDGWVEDGLSMTNMKIVSNADNQNITWDSHGVLCREYLPMTDEYDDRQLKIINRGLYVTDDNWRTSRAGIGNFRFWNPKTKNIEEGYGVIADKLVGNIVLSEQVGIYNEKNSFTLDENGLIITANVDTGKTDTVFAVQKKYTNSDNVETTDKLMYIDTDGTLVLNGRIMVNNLTGQSDMTLDDIADKDRYLLQINGAIDGLESKLNVKIGSLEHEVFAEDGSFSKLKHDIEGLSVQIGDGRKEATNYLEYTSSGLTVGNKTSGTWVGTRTRMGSSSVDILDNSGTSVASYGIATRIGYSNSQNVYITSSGINIRNGSTVISSFESNKISLGKNSQSSVIDIAGGSIRIKGRSGNNTGSIENAWGSGMHFCTGGFGWNGQDSYIIFSANTAGYEAAYGYHASTLGKMPHDNILGAVTLYESYSGASSGTIYISPSSSNYQYMSNNIVAIEIFYVIASSIGESRYCSQKVYDPNGKTVLLSYTTYRYGGGTHNMYYGAAEVLVTLGVGTRDGTISFISGTTGEAHLYDKGDDSWILPYVGDAYKVKILKVVGYR